MCTYVYVIVIIYFLIDIKGLMKPYCKLYIYMGWAFKTVDRTHYSSSGRSQWYK